MLGRHACRAGLADADVSLPFLTRRSLRLPDRYWLEGVVWKNLGRQPESKWMGNLAGTVKADNEAV